LRRWTRWYRFGRNGVNDEALRVLLFFGRRDDTCRQHHLLDRRDGDRRRFEVTETVTPRDRQRRPAVHVLRVPDVYSRALAGEELHDFGKVLVGRAVHGGFAVLVHGVDI